MFNTMSRTFRHIFLSSFLKEIIVKFPVQAIGFGSVCHLGYTLGTKDKKEIVVAKKYKFNTYGFTNFMIVDTDGNHYNVNNSTWFVKWDAIEDWSLIEVNDSLSVGVYGWRIPFLGTFPNIVSTSKKINLPTKIEHVLTEVGYEPRVVYIENNNNKEN